MIDKKKFAKLFGSMGGLMVAVTIIMVMSGSAMALPIAGIGGFTQQVDSLESPEFYLYPSLSQTDDPEDRLPAAPSGSGLGSYPTAAAELGSGTQIEGLVLFKDFTLSDYDDVGDIASVLPQVGADATARVQIRADNLTANGPLYIEQSSLTAETATFNGLEVITQQPGAGDDNNLLDTPTKFMQKANQQDPNVGAGNPLQNSTRFVGPIEADDPAIALENATIRSHYLAANSLTFDGLRLVVQFDMDGDGTFEFDGGIASP